MEQTAGGQKWTTKRLLIGAGIGCGALILFFVVVGVSVGYYFYIPGEQISTTRILDRGSTAVFRLENLGKDGGVNALLETVMEEAHRLNRERRKNLPEFARIFASFQKDYSSRDVENMKKYFPREVTVTMETLPGQAEPEPVFAINLSRFPRLIRFLFWLGNDEKKEPKADEFAIEFVESTMIGGRRSALNEILPRLNNPTEADSPDPELLEAYKSGDPRWDFHGVALNRDNIWGRYLSRHVEKAEADPGAADDFKDVRKVTFGIDIASADVAEGEVVLDCSDEAKAVEVLQTVAEDLRSDLEDAGFQADVSIERSTRFVTLRLKVNNLREATIAALRSASEKAGPRPNTERQ